MQHRNKEHEFLGRLANFCNIGGEIGGEIEAASTIFLPKLRGGWQVNLFFQTFLFFFCQGAT